MKPSAQSETVTESTAETPGHFRRVFHAFTYRDFRLLWFGSFTSSGGTWLQETALNWLLLQLTNSVFYLGINTFLSTAPILIFTLFGGVLADRLDRRRILLTSQWAQLTFAIILAGMVLFKVPAARLVPLMLLISFLTGCAQAFGGPAYQSLIPMMVERKDLPNAIALNSIQFQLARSIGAMAASLPFSRMGSQMEAAAVSFGLNGLSFLAVIVALNSLRVEHIPRQSSGNVRTQMSDGLRLVLGNEGLLSLTFLAFVSTFFGLQITAFFPYFARDIFLTRETGNSILSAISGIGGVTGALVVAGLGASRHKGRYALLMQVGLGLSIIGFTLAPNTRTAYPLLFIASVFMMCVFSLITSLVQLLVSDEMRGRVISIFVVAFRGGLPLGSLVTAFLTRYFSLPSILLVEGLLLCLIAIGFLFSRSQVTGK